MTFGANYKSKYLFHMNGGWSTEQIAEYLSQMGYLLGNIQYNLDEYSGHDSQAVFMVYQTVSDESVNICGYFTTEREVEQTYIPEGWEFQEVSAGEILT